MGKERKNERLFCVFFGVKREEGKTRLEKKKKKKKIVVVVGMIDHFFSFVPASEASDVVVVDSSFKNRKSTPRRFLSFLFAFSY